MKGLIGIGTFIFFSMISPVRANSSPESGNGGLTVIVKGITQLKGVVSIGLFFGADEFNGLKPNTRYRGKRVPASGESVEADFSGLQPGEYAVAIYQDENNNGKLDKNLLGMPKEKYGFSNNASGSFGPPTFDDAKVRLEDDRPVKIEVENK